MKKINIIYTLAFLFLFVNCKAYSQTVRDIKKIRDQIESLGTSNNNFNNKSKIDIENNDSSLPIEILIEPKEIADYYESELDRLKLIKEEFLKLSDTTNNLVKFGYDYFIKRDSVYFTNNKKINRNYILGSGDEVLITMWGDAELNIKKFINKNGSIFIDNVGQIKLSGKSINQALLAIKDRFAVKYSTLKSNKPTTYIDLNVGKLNPININMLGSVKIPGTHLVHPNSSIISTLIQTGGVNEIGSLRNIQLIRNGEIISTIDLYDYLIFGNTKNNSNVLDDDIILIPPIKNRIVVTGAVYREGYFEIKENETIDDVIMFTSGIKPGFVGRIYIDRIETINEINKNRRFFINLTDNSNYQLSMNDSIHFLNKPIFVPKVFVRGQVINPGEITLVENMSIFDALKQAGGINNPSFIKTMDLSRAEFVSRNENSRFSEVRIININNIINGDYQQNFILQPFDEISVYPNRNYLKIENVKIMGEVIFPGSYTLKEDLTSLKNLISRSGGFSDRAFQDGIRIYRDSSQVVWNNFNINLFPGDSIFVPQKPGVVSVEGEIYNPGYIEYRRNLSLRDYIDSAGGFTPKADKNKVIIIYPNGNVKRKNLFINPRVKEGAIILVNEKEIIDPIDWLSIASTTINLSTSIATILVLINQSQPSG